jgi:hypothetical protein
MHGQQNGVCFLRRFARRAGTSIALSLLSQLLEFSVAPSVAEYDIMPSARKDHSELPAHQSRTQNANSHAAFLAADN